MIASIRNGSLILLHLGLLVPALHAQEEGAEAAVEVLPEEDGYAQEDDAPAPAPQPEAAAAAQDGGRFRFGVNAAAGFESVASVSGPMFGVDVRLGYQVSDLLGIYVQPHLSFGSLSESSGGASVSGGTGTFALTVLGEATFLEQFFAGAGVGYGVLNNPSGFTFNARAGAYPFMSNDDDGVGRSGFMVAADLKTIFIDGATGVLVTAQVGYEDF